MSPRLVHVQAELPIRTPRGARRVAETRFDRTAWGATSSNHTIPTIQSSRTAETVVDRKEAVSAGIAVAYSERFRSLPTLTDHRAFLTASLRIQKFRSRQLNFGTELTGRR
jgi:hypothetical protein